MSLYTAVVSASIFLFIFTACNNSTSPELYGNLIADKISPTDTITAEINVGESVWLDQETELTFNSVIEDSRCPIGVMCFWAGTAEIELLINNQQYLLNTYLDPREIYFDDYNIKLINLLPYPVSDEEINYDSYVATIEITLNDKRVILIYHNDDNIIYRDPLDIKSLKIENDSLFSAVSYGGGCKEHDIKLYAYGEIMESYPPKMKVKFSHNGNNDMCEAYITEHKSYSLIPIKNHLRQWGYEKIILLIYPPHNNEKVEEISYEF